MPQNVNIVKRIHPLALLWILKVKIAVLKHFKAFMEKRKRNEIRPPLKLKNSRNTLQYKKISLFGKVIQFGFQKYVAHLLSIYFFRISFRDTVE